MFKIGKELGYVQRGEKNRFAVKLCEVGNKEKMYPKVLFSTETIGQDGNWYPQRQNLCPDCKHTAKIKCSCGKEIKNVYKNNLLDISEVDELISILQKIAMALLEKSERDNDYSENEDDPY